MWIKISINKRDFIIKISERDDGYEIMLSDFFKLWTEFLTKEQFLKRCKELNPLYEAEPDILLRKIFEVTNPEHRNVEKELLEVGNQLTITFSSHLKGFVFKFKFTLILSAPEKFCQSITMPLIQVIEELQARQKTLCDLLNRKDIEINEYKMEGVELSRKNIITPTFNEETFFENSFNKKEEQRSLKNLQCPFTYFEKSCSKLYEECSKRKRVVETMLSPKKDRTVTTPECSKTDLQPEAEKPKRNDIVFDDSDDDDETYFSMRNAEIQPTIKNEVRTKNVKKRKKELNL